MDPYPDLERGLLGLAAGGAGSDPKLLCVGGVPRPSSGWVAADLGNTLGRHRCGVMVDVKWNAQVKGDLLHPQLLQKKSMDE